MSTLKNRHSETNASIPDMALLEVDYFPKYNVEHCIKSVDDITCTDQSSVTSSVEPLNFNTAIPIDNRVAIIIALDSIVHPERHVNGTLESRCLQCNVPDSNYAIYYSNDSADAKPKKMKVQIWVTDSLREEISRYIPQCYCVIFIHWFLEFLE